MISLTEVLAGGSLFLGALLGAGAVLAAPVSIAAERSRGTLDSLHLTPLRAGAILDGKAAGCFWALFPGLTLLAVHLGLLCLLSGFRVAGVLVFLLTVSAWLLLLVQAGLWISTRSRGPIRALLAMILALHVFAAANGLLIMLFGFFGPLGLYVNPVYWVVLALGWGGARDLVQVWALAPLWGYALMFFACGLWAWDLRRRAIGVFEARRVT